MPDLNFSVDRASAVKFAASPILNFSLKIRETGGEAIHAVVLRCQIRIEPLRRRYGENDREGLGDLFGEPARWGQTMHAMLWTHAAVMVPPFTGETVVELPVPCTYDFNIAATKYFAALEGGEVPLNLLFSGTVFYEGEDGLQVTQISWEKETNFALPVAVWKEMMEIYYPNSAWLCLRKDAFDALRKYRSSLSLTSWEAAIERLLESAGEEAAEK
jgi:hypothetical protein